MNQQSCGFRFLPSLGLLALVILGPFLLAIRCPLVAAEPTDEGLTARVDFDRDVRPILSNHCFQCHGPDEAELQAGLRLDQKASVFGPSDSGNRAVVPGQADSSELVRRILSNDDDQRMPPAEHGKPLSQDQVALLTRWVEQGAVWTNHWAFEPVAEPTIPTSNLASGRVHNAIDSFVLSKLATRGLVQSPLESRARLIRRVSLDLTGLPPAVEDVDAFVKDESPDAFEKVVDRLLSSQHFGERLAVPWLDLARYGDTSGYHNDSLRDMWLWRQWVIQAFNKNIPFDQFTIEQLAGDLIPEATIDQQIASGFHRNVMTSDEGGLIDAEYRNLYVVDRVATTGVTWLGLTVACAQCHDHKYDPITQADFYSLYAFFNNVPENGKDGVRDRNPKPFLRVPSPADELRLHDLNAETTAAETALTQVTADLANRQAQWEADLCAANAETDPQHSRLLAAAQFPLDGTAEGRLAAAEHPPAPGPRTSHTASAPAASATAASSTAALSSTLSANVYGDAHYRDAAAGQGLECAGATWLEYGDHFGFTKDLPFSVAAYLSVTAKGGSPFGKMDDANAARGWDVEFHGLRPSVHLIHHWSDSAIHVQADQDFVEGELTHLAVTYDGSGKAAGLKMYIDGNLAKSSVKIDNLAAEITNTLPLSIGRRGAASTNFHGLIDDVRLYQRELSAAEVSSLATEPIRAIVQQPVTDRSETQQKLVQLYFQRTQVPELQELRAKLASLKQATEEFTNALPNTMVMSEMETPRQTFIKVRGNYDLDGEPVVAAVPAFLPQIEPRENGNLNRLDLARWLTSPQHPLTARVAVNRWWTMLFGTGLVKTVNDFGSQGERPSHPDLLDWMAADFIRDWDIKRAIKQMVMSATYQQSAQTSTELLELDSENRWLARGPRQRLDAEFLRDNALTIAGLLNPALGGRSIKPAQPAGTWEINEMSGYAYEKSSGADLYRRGLYVYWRRSTVYPSFVTLDAPTREFCVAQRAKTSTPLQSLVLMNDPVFVEAARGLAQRVLLEPNGDQDTRLTKAWRLALAREPSPHELKILQRTLEQQLANYRADPAAASQLNQVGDLAVPAALDATELAAWTAVSNVLLNLNETISN